MRSDARKILRFHAMVFVLLLSTSCAGVHAGTKTGLSVAPSSLSFGSQSINVSATSGVTISNVGKTPLQVQNVTMNGSTVFQLTNWTGKVTLQPGNSLQVSISFTPAAATTYNATLAVTTNSNDANIPVSGTGVAPSGSQTSVGISISPTAATLQVGTTQQFTATVTGTTNTGVTWLVNGVQGGNSTVGTITSGGLYTAPATVPTGTITVAAVSSADTTKSSSASVTITAAPAPVSVAVSPTSATLQVGATQQFTASVTGTTNTSVSWLVNNVQGGNSTVGTINSSGLYTAPGAVPSGGTVTVTADSNADTTKSANAAVDVTAASSPVSVAVSPTSATVAAGASQQFTATVTGTTNTGVSWSVNAVQGGNSSYGTISSSGLYTAPTCPSLSSVSVTATSVYDATASASATATLSGTAGSGGNYYVATNGSDSNDGSACHPWATFAHADAAISPGATVHVAPGTYTETPSLNTSGTSSARIRWVSDSRWGAHINPAVCDTCAVVTINSNYLDFEGFDVGGGYGYTGVLNWGSYNRMLGNLVHDIPAPSCGSLGGSAIVNANYSGSDNDIIGNVVHDIGVPGACNTVQGIYHSNLRGHIQNNVVYRISAYGIQLWHAANNVVVTNNTVFKCGGHQISYMGGGIIIGAGDSPGGVTNDYTIVANNIVYDNERGIREYGSTGIHNQYLNNLSYGNYEGDWFLQNGLTASGTVTADPQFVNYTGDSTGDYHLQSTSPAINAGTSTTAPSIDFDGGARPVGGAWDIGAYEYGAKPGVWPWY